MSENGNKRKAEETGSVQKKKAKTSAQSSGEASVGPEEAQASPAQNFLAWLQDQETQFLRKDS